MKKRKKEKMVTFPQKYLLIGLAILAISLTVGLALLNLGITGRVTQILSKQPELIVLSAETGSPLPVDKVIIDGQNFGPAPMGKIIIEGLSLGEHQLILIINGAKYSKSFTFEGEDISLYLPEPVTVKVAVWSKTTNVPIENVNVFLDEEGIVCTTNNQGICTFPASPEKHVIRLQGNGIFHEELVSISKDSNSFTFKVERELNVKVKVYDELTNEPLEDVSVYFDGLFKGKTSPDGSLLITKIKEGSHSIRVEYKQVSKDVTQVITFESNEVIIKIKAPRTITIELKDSETGKPIDFMKIFLEGISITYRSFLETDDDGRTLIPDVLPGTYQIRLEGVPTLVKPSKQIIIGADEFISVTVDMPNPRFQGSLNCNEKLGFFDVYGVCEVTVKNINYERGIVTQDTVVILLVYLQDENGNYVLVDKDLLDFEPILPGDSRPKTSTDLYGFQFGKQETVVAIIFEGWKYTPQSNEQIGEITLPISLVEQAINDGINYCKQNFGECVKVISGIIGTLV